MCALNAANAVTRTLVRLLNAETVNATMKRNQQTQFVDQPAEDAINQNTVTEILSIVQMTVFNLRATYAAVQQGHAIDRNTVQEIQTIAQMMSIMDPTGNAGQQLDTVICLKTVTEGLRLAQVIATKVVMSYAVMP